VGLYNQKEVEGKSEIAYSAITLEGEEGKIHDLQMFWQQP
jgi:hypothetical protein